MEQLTSNNKFTFHGEDTGLSVVDFWSWAYSDLLNNTDRGVLAEYIVYSALLPPPRFENANRLAPLRFNQSYRTTNRSQIRFLSPVLG